MPPLKDLTGQIFGDLKVLKRAPNIGNKVAWECQCSCGKIITVRGDVLKTKTSCGCKTVRSDFKDVAIGEVFSRLTVISPSRRKSNGKMECDCKCECGNIISVEIKNLRHGVTHSCGCYQKDKVAEIGNANSLDLTNRKFGKLTAKFPTNKRSNGCVIWYCECECGGVKEVPTTRLVQRLTCSCGCSGSIGEEAIFTLLKNAGYKFETEKTFNTCNFDKPARFDFYVSNSYLIEYDGIQHFKVHGWNTQERFEYIQKHDEYKNQWCKENNIPLIRIPYTKLDTLCIEDLMLETTQFRVV